MAKKREDMTPEEYEAIKKRLADMRAKSIEVYKQKKEAKEKMIKEKSVETPKMTEEVIEESIVNITVPASVVKEPLPVPVPVHKPPAPTIIEKTPSLPIPETPRKVQTPMFDFDLDKYMEAKYKAKSKYIKQPVSAPVVAPSTPPQQAESVLYRSAKEEIRNRVNDEVLKLAMKSVFPTYYS